MTVQAEDDIKSNIINLKNSLAILDQGPVISASSTAPSLQTTKKPHIILVQLESISDWLLKLEPSPMPFLKDLSKKETAIPSFYGNGCITVNAELAVNCSFYPDTYGPIGDIYAKNNFYCLPTILHNNYNYKTFSHHANTLAFWNRTDLNPAWGYENSFFQPFYKNRELETKIFDQVIKNIKKSTTPTLNEVITLSTHSPHNATIAKLYSNKIGQTIKPFAGPLPYPATVILEKEETARYYLAMTKIIDDSLKYLFAELEKNKLLDNTIVVIYGDHALYNFGSPNKLDNFYNYQRLPLVMHIPKYKNQLSGIGSQVDIAPTLLRLIDPQAVIPDYFIGKNLFDRPNNFAINKCLGVNTYVSSTTVISYDRRSDLFDNLLGASSSDRVSLAEALRQVTLSSDNILDKNEITSKLKSGQTKKNVILNKNSILRFDQSTDADHDGLSNLREFAIGSQKNNADTDKDGHLDGIELINGYNIFGAGKASPFIPSVEPKFKK